MTKTLRITSVLIALSAIGFVLFIAVTGLSAEEEIEAFLKTPGLAKQLQAGSADEKGQQEQDSALVRQAKAFALRIDPPPPPKPVNETKMPAKIAPLRPKAPVSAQFEVVGTSFYPLHPANSWALINEVGKGWHWVKQGGKVGHLIIKEVADGYVVIDDGGKSYELSPKRSEQASLLKDLGGDGVGGIENNDALKSFIEVVEKKQDAKPAEKKQPAEKQEKPKRPKEKLRSNVEWLKTLQKERGSMELGAEEAKELSNVGDILSSLEKELNSLRDNNSNDSNKVMDANNAKDSNTAEENDKK